MLGLIPKLHTTSTFKFQRIEADPTSATFDRAIEQAANGNLVEMAMIHPVRDPAASGEALATAILGEYESINRNLDWKRDVRWWVYVEDEVGGGDLQRQMLAYALASCPMCD